jgi:hypothetical protein
MHGGNFFWKMIEILTVHNKYTTTRYNEVGPTHEKWSLHLTTAPQQADVAGNILLFFYKKKWKQNKKIREMIHTLISHNSPTTSWRGC